MTRYSEEDRSRTLDRWVESYKKKHFQLLELRRTHARMRGKEWSWWWFLLGGFLTGGLLWFLYPIYFLFSSPRTIEISIDDAGIAQIRKS